MQATTSRRMMTVQASSSAAVPMTRAAARSMAVSSRFALTSWEDSRQSSALLQQATPKGSHSGAPRRKAATMMANHATTGPFAPLVVVTRNILGEKEFNKLRGKGISLHSQVIKDFCKIWGIDNKQVQGVIRVAKKNGEKLGFLA